MAQHKPHFPCLILTDRGMTVKVQPEAWKGLPYARFVNPLAKEEYPFGIPIHASLSSLTSKSWSISIHPMTL